MSEKQLRFPVTKRTLDVESTSCLYVRLACMDQDWFGATSY